MLKRVKRLLIGVCVGILLVVGVIWILAQTLGLKQVLYQGQPIIYWQMACLSTNESERSQAINLLNSQILPDLTNTMFHDWKDSEFRMEVISRLNELPWVEIHYVPAAGRRGGAAAALGNFGPPASAAIPALIQALNGPDGAVRERAAISLGRIHSQPDLVIPMLISYLSNPDLAGAAVEGLGGYGPLAKPAVSQLVALFPDPDPELHHAVWYALQAIDPETLTRVVLEFQSPHEAPATSPPPSAEPATNTATPISSAK